MVRCGLDTAAPLIDLEPDMKVIAEASNGAEAVAQFKLHAPDVTLMDLELPRMDGIEAVAIRREHADARVIVLTMYQGDEDIHRAIQAVSRCLPAEGHRSRSADQSHP
jgi:DNA-binding NarL/FixJ family response regulator